MPTIEDLIIRAKYLIDDVVDIDIILQFFNECLEDLSDVAGYIQTIEYTKDANDGVISIPAKLIDPIKLTIHIEGKEEEELDMVPYNTTMYIDYREHIYFLLGNEITIKPAPKAPYTVKLVYFSELPTIPPRDVDPSLSTDIGIPARYHKALPLYAAYRYFENWEEDYVMQQNFRTQYEQVKEALSYHASVRDNRINDNRVKVNRMWE